MMLMIVDFFIVFVQKFCFLSSHLSNAMSAFIFSTIIIYEYGLEVKIHLMLKHQVEVIVMSTLTGLIWSLVYLKSISTDNAACTTDFSCYSTTAKQE